jgi:UTP--glucose-1-phosphate uridylyltransferase
MIDIYEKYNCSVLGSVKATKDEDYDRYGFAGGEEIEPGLIDTRVIIEKPGKAAAPSDLANVSGFLFTPDIFEYLEKILEELREGEEFYYNDALKRMLSDDKRILAAEIKGGKYYDTGNKLEYMKTVVELGLKNEDIKDEFKKFLEGLNI